MGLRSKTFIVVRGQNRERVTIGRYPDISPADARTEARRLLVTTPEGKTVRKSFGEARETFVEENYKEASARTRYQVNRLLTLHFKSLEAKQLADIDYEQVKRCLDKLADRPSEQLHAYRSVRTFFNWCVRPPRRYIKHSPMEGYVTRLMLTLPQVEGRNATILDMLKLMADPAPYKRAMDALPDIPREFFARDFMSKSFEGTKEQVRYRLQAIIESPTMARLFTAPETKIDFFTEMNRGAVILVDTAKDFLKDGSAIFGKLLISLILQAVLERAAIPERERKPTFLMVDEAGSFF